MLMRDFSLYTDTDLMKLLADGDEHAFSEIYARHWERMYKTGYYILKNEHAGKDIVQEIFIWLWEHRSKVNIQSLQPYLIAAVKFKVANFIRAGNIRHHFFTDLKEFTPPALSNSSEIVELKQLKQIIRQTVEDLPEKCQEIFRLSREHYLTNQQIAERLHLSVKTVESQMTKALRKLRHALKPHVFFVGDFALILSCLRAEEFFQSM